MTAENEALRERELLQAEYNEVVKEYGLETFVENTRENWERIQELDERLVWTNHSTCEDEMVTSGAHMFSNSCCWETHGWYVATRAWTGDSGSDSVKSTAYMACVSCNPRQLDEDEVEEEGVEFDPDCDDCCGDGWATYYFD